MINRIWTLLIASLLVSLLLINCSSDNPESENIKIEKITFPTSTYTIDSKRDTTIFGEQGTRIFICANSFRFEDNSIKDSITIELKEFYKMSDIAISNLSTTSEGKLIETGGMIYINVSSNGKTLELMDDKKIVVHFPKNHDDYRNMNLFYADNQATNEEVPNWIIDTVDLVKSTVRINTYGYTCPHDIEDDDTWSFDFKPLNYSDSGYFWNPLDFYVNQFEFTKEAIDEINNYSGFLSINFTLTKGGAISNPKVNADISNATKQEILNFTNNLPKFIPYTDKNKIIYDLESSFSISGGILIPLYKSDEDYISSFDKKYAQYESSPIKSMNDAELNYYIFSVAKLGWINCDRFVETDELIDVVIKTPADPNTKIKMVFSDIDGVMNAVQSEGFYKISNVPKNKVVTVIGMKNNKGQFSTSVKKITTSETSINSLTFEKTTLSELRAKIEKL